MLDDPSGGIQSQEDPMIGYLIEVIVASIVVSVVSSALHLTPKYPKRIHRILQQVLNTGLLTVLLIYLFANDIEPGLVVTGSMIFLVFIASIVATNFIARKRGQNTA
jgi:biotin transporter BioY